MNDESAPLTRAEMLAAVLDYRARLQDSAAGTDVPRLRAQLYELEIKLLDGEVPTEDWEQFELHWQTHLADAQREILRRSAQIMLAYEDIERQDPNHFADDGW